MVKKGEKAFRPYKLPRYLPGSVAKEILITDLKTYNMHRFNIFSATPAIDAKPPGMNPYNYINLRKFQEDEGRLRDIERDNKELIAKINIINRTKGVINCWPDENSFRTNSKWQAHVNNMHRINKENVAMYKRICESYSNYPRKAHLENHKMQYQQMKDVCKYPLVPLHGPPLDDLLQDEPSISNGLVQVDSRPKVFMDFSIQWGPCLTKLGRVVIELYADCAPNTVKNFLTICQGNKGWTYENCKIYRSKRDKYFETGDITCGNGRGGHSIFGPTFDEEENDLKHTKQGVLSMVRLDLTTNHKNNSRFSVTMNPMPELDGKRLVFGKVIKGNKTLCKINDTSRKDGAPMEKILITKCGDYPERQLDIIVCNIEH
ncbi:PREDICTED: peptidyl-prolyl cis-trans isomerase E-like [Nicrophorus vespilloides]|uniref:Peptidyl-prolyl cis-trans isomerase E-like n=1 Tax=Nicrophorus vespilloides TaxID=110193 RepID=A0ABM1NFL3_NICVS|nr:PREDICTED: peptidyl-prolyl cis-trans isomerase E-like [Nicrophorus vespilloides]